MGDPPLKPVEVRGDGPIIHRASVSSLVCTGVALDREEVIDVIAQRPERRAWTDDLVVSVADDSSQVLEAI